MKSTLFRPVVFHIASAAVGKSGTIISSKRLLLWGGGINYDLAKTMEKLTEGDDLYGDVVINYLNRTACEWVTYPTALISVQIFNDDIYTGGLFLFYPWIDRFSIDASFARH